MSFTGQLRAFNTKTKAVLNDTRRSAIVKLFSAVIKDTPVLTGRLRGNWQTTIGSPALGVLDRISGEEAITEVLEKAKQSTGRDVVILRNNLPYAYRIEYDGWSKSKAPQGMVRRNTVRFQRLINEAIREGRV